MKKHDEIKKGLEHCAEDGCKKCPYEDDCNTADGFSVLAADAIDLINQLEADNAQKDRCIENMTDKMNAMIEEEAKLKAEHGLIVSVRHGRWERIRSCYYCTVCRAGYKICNGGANVSRFNFCPNCGARMDAKEEQQ